MRIGLDLTNYSNYSSSKLKTQEQIDSDVEKFLKAGGSVKKYDSFGKEILIQ